MLGLCALVLAIAVVVIVSGLWGVRDRLRAEKTLANMNELAGLIEYERERIDSVDDVWKIVEEYDREWVKRDGWGNRLVVETSEDGGGALRVRSLGKDGERGDCCHGRVAGNWSADAVVEVPRQWLQYWDT